MVLYLTSIRTLLAAATQRIRQKSDIIGSFKKLFELSDFIPNWVISYNNRSYQRIDTMVDLIKPFRNVRVEYKTYQQSKGGKGSVAGSSEILLICTKQKTNT